jgi:hypothetical protein
MASEFPDIPQDMRRVYQRFERWRSAHTGRLPIPERLWAAAVELAQQHGVFATAKALHLEYGKLKRLADALVPGLKGRVEKAPTALRQTQVITRHRTTVPRGARVRPRPPAFVELLAPRPGSSRECRVELEGPGGRMRIEVKGIATAELVALSRALWDGSDPTDEGEA